MASSSPSGAYAATKLYDQCLRGMATVPTTVHTKTLQFEEIVNLFLSGNHAIATNALIEFTNEALFAFYLGEGKDGVDGQDSLLDEIIKISEKFSSHLVSDVINFSTQRMRAYNCYRNGDFEMVIKILNPLIGKCPMQNGNHVAGLADLLIILSEAFAELSSFDDAMHSARLSAYIAHKRFEYMQKQNKNSFNNAAALSTATMTNTDAINTVFDNGIGPILDPQTAVVLAYHTVANQTWRVDKVSHLSIEWHERALQSALKFNLDMRTIHALQKALRKAHSYRQTNLDAEQGVTVTHADARPRPTSSVPYVKSTNESGFVKAPVMRSSSDSHLQKALISQQSDAITNNASASREKQSNIRATSPRNAMRPHSSSSSTPTPTPTPPSSSSTSFHDKDNVATTMIHQSTTSIPHNHKALTKGGWGGHGTDVSLIISGPLPHLLYRDINYNNDSNDNNHYNNATTTATTTTTANNNSSINYNSGYNYNNGYNNGFMDNSNVKYLQDGNYDINNNDSVNDTQKGENLNVQIQTSHNNRSKIYNNFVESDEDGFGSLTASMSGGSGSIILHNKEGSAGSNRLRPVSALSKLGGGYTNKKPSESNGLYINSVHNAASVKNVHHTRDGTSENVHSHKSTKRIHSTARAGTGAGAGENKHNQKHVKDMERSDDDKVPAVVLLQSVGRSYVSRNRVKALRRQAQFLQWRERTRAAIRIQKWVRGFITRRMIKAILVRYKDCHSEAERKELKNALKEVARSEKGASLFLLEREKLLDKVKKARISFALEHQKEKMQLMTEKLQMERILSQQKSEFESHILALKTASENAVAVATDEALKKTRLEFAERLKEEISKLQNLQVTAAGTAAAAATATSSIDASDGKRSSDLATLDALALASSAFPVGSFVELVNTPQTMLNSDKSDQSDTDRAMTLVSTDNQSSIARIIKIRHDDTFDVEIFTSTTTSSSPLIPPPPLPPLIENTEPQVPLDSLDNLSQGPGKGEGEGDTVSMPSETGKLNNHGFGFGLGFVKSIERYVPLYRIRVPKVEVLPIISTILEYEKTSLSTSSPSTDQKEKIKPEEHEDQRRNKHSSSSSNPGLGLGLDRFIPPTNLLFEKRRARAMRDQCDADMHAYMKTMYDGFAHRHEKVHKKIHRLRQKMCTKIQALVRGVLLRRRLVQLLNQLMTSRALRLKEKELQLREKELNATYEALKELVLDDTNRVIQSSIERLKQLENMPHGGMDEFHNSDVLETTDATNVHLQDAITSPHTFSPLEHLKDIRGDASSSPFSQMMSLSPSGNVGTPPPIHSISPLAASNVAIVDIHNDDKSAHVTALDPTSTGSSDRDPLTSALTDDKVCELLKKFSNATIEEIVNSMQRQQTTQLLEALKLDAISSHSQRLAMVLVTSPPSWEVKATTAFPIAGKPLPHLFHMTHTPSSSSSSSFSSSSSSQAQQIQEHFFIFQLGNTNNNETVDPASDHDATASLVISRGNESYNLFKDINNDTNQILPQHKTPLRLYLAEMNSKETFEYQFKAPHAADTATPTPAPAPVQSSDQKGGFGSWFSMRSSKGKAAQSQSQSQSQAQTQEKVDDVTNIQVIVMNTEMNDFFA